MAKTKATYYSDSRYKPSMTIRDMMEAGITPKYEARDNRSLLDLPYVRKPSKTRADEPERACGTAAKPNLLQLFTQTSQMFLVL